MVDPIRSAFETFASEVGYTRNRGGWYWRGIEVVSVLNLQKSNFGDVYYINVAESLLEAAQDVFPRENRCHVRTRLSLLVPEAELPELELLLDLTREAEDRSARLLSFLRQHLRPYKLGTLEDFTTAAGVRLLKASLINAEGQKVLKAAGVGPAQLGE